MSENLRASYVSGLQTEHASLSSRPDSAERARRLAEVEAELSKYDAEPARRVLETTSQHAPVREASLPGQERPAEQGPVTPDPLPAAPAQTSVVAEPGVEPEPVVEPAPAEPDPEPEAKAPRRSRAKA